MSCLMKPVPDLHTWMCQRDKVISRHVTGKFPEASEYDQSLSLLQMDRQSLLFLFREQGRLLFYMKRIN